MEEVDNMSEENKAILYEVVDSDNLQQIFEVVDIEADGQVSIDEFIEGLTLIGTSESKMLMSNSFSPKKDELTN